MAEIDDLKTSVTTVQTAVDTGVAEIQRLVAKILAAPTPAAVAQAAVDLNAAATKLSDAVTAANTAAP